MNYRLIFHSDWAIDEPIHLGFTHTNNG
jgi:hypothetical protein